MPVEQRIAVQSDVVDSSVLEAVRRSAAFRGGDAALSTFIYIYGETTQQQFPHVAFSRVYQSMTIRNTRDVSSNVSAIFSNIFSDSENFYHSYAKRPHSSRRRLGSAALQHPPRLLGDLLLVAQQL